MPARPPRISTLRAADLPELSPQSGERLIRQLQLDSEDTNTAVTALNADVAGIGDDVDGLETDVAALDARVTALEGEDGGGRDPLEFSGFGVGMRVSVKAISGNVVSDSTAWGSGGTVAFVTSGNAHYARLTSAVGDPFTHYFWANPSAVIAVGDRPSMAASILTGSDVSSIRIHIGFGEGGEVIQQQTPSATSGREYVAFRVDTAIGGNWLCAVGDGTTDSPTDSGVAVAANTIYRLALIWNGTGYDFFVNGTEVASGLSVTATSTLVYGLVSVRTLHGVDPRQLFMRGASVDLGE